MWTEEIKELNVLSEVKRTLWDFSYSESLWPTHLVAHPPWVSHNKAVCFGAGVCINSCCIFWQKRCSFWERYIKFSMYHVYHRHFCSWKGLARAVHVFVTFPEQKQICPYEISWCLLILACPPACILKVVFSGRSFLWLLSTPGTSQHPSGCRISCGRTVRAADGNCSAKPCATDPCETCLHFSRGF